MPLLTAGRCTAVLCRARSSRGGGEVASVSVQVYTRCCYLFRHRGTALLYAAPRPGPDCWARVQQSAGRAQPSTRIILRIQNNSQWRHNGGGDPSHPGYISWSCRPGAWWRVTLAKGCASDRRQRRCCSVHAGTAFLSVQSPWSPCSVVRCPHQHQASYHCS